MFWTIDVMKIDVLVVDVLELDVLGARRLIHQTITNNVHKLQRRSLILIMANTLIWLILSVFQRQFWCINTYQLPKKPLWLILAFTKSYSLTQSDHIKGSSRRETSQFQFLRYLKFKFHIFESF